MGTEVAAASVKADSMLANVVENRFRTDGERSTNFRLAELQNAGVVAGPRGDSCRANSSSCAAPDAVVELH